MEKTLNRPGKAHIGRNIVRIRELKGMKQETLAANLGVTQQTVSKLEQSETLEEEKLKEVAEALGVPPESIQSFNEEAAINIFSSTLHDQAGSINHQPIFNFNPIDKIVDLYERLLASEREKIEILKGKSNK